MLTLTLSDVSGNTFSTPMEEDAAAAICNNGVITRLVERKERTVFIEYADGGAALATLYTEDDPLLMDCE